MTSWPSGALAKHPRQHSSFFGLTKRVSVFRAEQEVNECVPLTRKRSECTNV